eukprot:2708271-Karenia_brevis.AAC.1
MARVCSKVVMSQGVKYCKLPLQTKFQKFFAFASTVTLCKTSKYQGVILRQGRSKHILSIDTNH